MKSRNAVVALLILWGWVLFSGCATLDNYYSTHDPNDDYYESMPGWGVAWGRSGRASWDNYYGYQGTDTDLLYDFGPRRGE